MKQAKSSIVISNKCDILVNIGAIKQNVKFSVLDTCVTYGNLGLDVLKISNQTIDFSAYVISQIRTQLTTNNYSKILHFI